MPELEDQRNARAATLAVVVLAVLLGTLLVVTDSRDSSAPLAVATGRRHEQVTTTTPAATTTTTAAVPQGSGAPTTTSTTVDPGALPQTDERPSASGPTFTSGVDDLWEAIRQDQPALGLPFFFPERAYLQVKAIGDPAGDYQQRLIANFQEDVHTLHAQLGPHAADAEFVGIDVPDDQAVLVQPGEEYNRLSYWRVYGTALRYMVDGRAGSFPVTSMISWRGQWYVVHLGVIR